MLPQQRGTRGTLLDLNNATKLVTVRRGVRPGVRPGAPAGEAAIPARQVEREGRSLVDAVLVAARPLPDDLELPGTATGAAEPKGCHRSDAVAPRNSSGDIK